MVRVVREIEARDISRSGLQAGSGRRGGSELRAGPGLRTGSGLWAGSVLLACVALAGCAPRTSISTTGNLPAQYTHAFVTIQGIWLSPNATASPNDSSWTQFTLTTPVTVDLASSLDGALTQIASGLNLPVGTYNQIRLIPVDSSAALLASAQSLGAIFNTEADFVDTAGTSFQFPLELQNPDKGIGIPATITISRDNSASFPLATSNSGTSSTGSVFTPTSTGIDGASGATTTTGTTVAASSTSTNTITPVSVAINIDGGRDLVPFVYSGVSGILLNPHATAYVSTAVGAIQGSVSIANLTGIENTVNHVQIQVTAESLSTDGLRHVAVNSAPVRSDGTFVLYPLATSTSTPTSYDLVVHGPGIATVIVKNVSVTQGDPANTTPVSVGTLAPRSADSFNVNLNTNAPLPAGALVGFYQTLPGSGEVPYLIEERPIDPFNRNFAQDQAISTGTIDSGTFSSGASVALTTSTPLEGAGSYRASATAPFYADGALTTTVSTPGGTSTATVLVAVPTLSVASGSASNSLSLALTQSTQGKYNKGELIVSHDGAIVATAPLDSLFAQGGSGQLTITGLPGGTASAALLSAVYFISVRAWNSNNPTGTLSREIYPTPADLSVGNVTGFPVNID